MSDNLDFSCIDMVVHKNGSLWIEHYDQITIIDTLKKTSKNIMLPEWAFDPQSIATGSGEVIYILNDKLLIFPETMPYNKVIPPVYITSLFINDKNISEIISEADYVPDLNRYRYFMSGIDNDTIISGPGLPAEYKQMPPGRYRFWVTGSNNDGIWNPTGTFIDIRIHPPWYRSVVAYIYYLNAFIVFITGYIRLRTYRLKKDKIKLEEKVEAATAELELKNRQMEEVDRIKTHFFTDISHEVRTPPSLILGPLENI